ncbi:KamA family radical SAM protein [Cardiobacteriaceae bacterium TAE3-ERU3]|nr:KamA family radical SAM protein [Cardiobacteriaceae bacterium TAE3-ERU3]
MSGSQLMPWTDEQLAVLDHYQYAVTPAMLSQMHTTEPEHDPIAAQFVPDARELSILPAELNDPIGDERHSPVAGLVHRYDNRVLWLMAPTCAVYCRFCFRKEHIGRNGRALTAAERDAALAYIAANQQVEEVILSGGDPLNMSAAQLPKFITPLNGYSHIRRLRIHTRIPVVAPEKIDARLLSLLSQQKQRVCVVLHINHANELSGKAIEAIAALRNIGVLLFSQTVLLRGVNDSVVALADLCNALLDAGVSPYYLHHLDLARGSNHFRLTLAEGLAIHQALRARLSGIALPAYIVEIPGGGGKVPVADLSVEQRDYLKQCGID